MSVSINARHTGDWARVALVCARDTSHSGYVVEILRHSGIPHDLAEPDMLREALENSDVVVLSGDVAGSPEDIDAIGTFVARGGALISIGACGGLGGVLGVEPCTPDAHLGEGYLVPSAKHVIAGDDTFPIHFFGGAAAAAGPAKALVEVLDSHGKPSGRAGVTLRETGSGLAIFVAPCVGETGVRIRQGAYVDMDGIPATDGSAPIADAVLRSEDGSVLDWTLDRDGGDENDPPGFLHPAVDRLAGIVIRAILYAVQRQRLTLPVIWYYPNNAAATGVVSFSTGGSDPQNAVSILHQANLVGVRGTWCVHPPGYPPEVYRVLRARGHEVGLRFDVDEPGSWQKERLKVQATQICRSAGRRLTYSVQVSEGRWEGRNQFYAWCSEQDIRFELGRGPMHAGNSGFPFGTCHPFRPMRDDGHFYSTLSLPFLARDAGRTISSVRCLTLVDRVVAEYGVAHFNFGTDRFEDPDVSAAFRNLVAHGRARGVEWVPAEEIGEFERARRAMKLQLSTVKDNLVATLQSEMDMGDATLLILGEPLVGATANEKELRVQPVERYGFSFSSLVLDLPMKRTALVELRRPEAFRKAG